jgi:hypothetical protein
MIDFICEYPMAVIFTSVLQGIPVKDSPQLTMV